MRAPGHSSPRRDTLPFRSFVLVWAMLFLGLSSGLEAYGHAGCAHHDAGAAVASHAAHGDAGDPGHDGHRSACTCIGDCSTASGVPLLAERAGDLLVAAAEAAAAPPVPYRAPLRRALIPHLLPYGQAPPLAS